jgi:hypothetical protein
MRVRLLPFVVCAAVVATACRPQPAVEGSGPRVVVFQDGSWPDARDVVSPGVLGVQVGLAGALSLEVVETGSSGAAGSAQVEAAAADPSVVAAVVAPLTELAEGAVAALRAAGIPVLSLSSSIPAPRGTGAPWRSFVPTVRQEASALARLAAPSRVGASVCVAGGQEGAWSASLATATVRRSGARTGVAARTAALSGAPAEVATAALRRGCGELIWTGSAGDAATLWGTLAAAPDPPALLVADRARTVGLLEAIGPVAASAGLAGICACVDLTTSRDPRAQRFLHDFQAATGLDPGPFAAEGWDVGRALAWIVRQGSASRAAVSAGLEARSRIGGVGGPYAWTRSGALVRPGPHGYRAVGWRWVRPIVAPGMSGVRADLSGGST